jgi:hypothetical protein
MKRLFPAWPLLAILVLPLSGNAAAASAPPENAAPAPPAVPAAGSVARAQFTSAVRNLEPVDALMTLGNDKTRIVYFTEILNMAGQTVIHRWEYHGKIMAEIPFKVGAARWRVYSTKRSSHPGLANGRLQW